MGLDEFFQMMHDKPAAAEKKAEGGAPRVGPKKLEMTDLLNTMVTNKASDLYVKVGRPPILRIAGELSLMTAPPFDAEEARRVLTSVMNKLQVAKFEEHLELDFSYGLSDKARYRFNVFFQRGVMGGVVRMISYEIPEIESLGLPLALKDLILRPHGLILVTGPAGSGKSTTMAAMIKHLNRTKACHVITIEDPIEFVHKDELAVIEQREVELDTLSFAEALRHILRQDPNLIVIGEMRDVETMSISIRAAETGHLVMSTLHTNDTAQTIDRIVDSYESSHQQEQVRMQLSQVLLGVCCQRLVRKADGSGLVPAVEFMVDSPLIQKLIREGQTNKITDAVEQSLSQVDMQTMDQALLKLYRNRVITLEDAINASTRPEDFKLKATGVTKVR
jgi:twitching motility protein PilT